MLLPYETKVYWQYFPYIVERWLTRTNLSFIHFLAFYSVFKLGVTASAIGMVFIQYERCSHVKILSFVIIIHKFCIKFI